ncbi:hypothetical protein KVR01_007620 [Diaporthe batatas]|uniref:uncharacterized protein n=1 Tax=Diaporthe batatas TaxID=748121 RepID=UPI001D04F7CA|nr:uncharacterized protein KVR01_007620 [Diaporthe batatas]KAG8163142.1 hypothetical protein KVR01_007620 [Diaporthe batatas]
MDPSDFFTDSALMSPDIVKTAHYTRRSYVIPASQPKPGDTSVRHGLGSQLRLAAHEYLVAGANDGGHTIILTHGTSFNKYFWGLVIEYILSTPGVKPAVKRLIAIDAANHGDSAVLNRGILPSKACWPDDSRDILHTLEYFNAQQPVIGIGHSFGGGAMCHAAMMKPDAFVATIFVEPILFQMKEQTEAVAQKALRRRDRWESTDAMRSGFSRGFKDWDKRQLDVFLEQGVIPLLQDGRPSVWALKTPKEQEASCYETGQATYLAAPHPQILDLLQRSKQRHHFIWGSESIVIPHGDIPLLTVDSFDSSEENRRLVERMVIPPSTTRVINGAGHLIPMTHPETLSSILAGLLRETAPVARTEIPQRFRL